VEVTGSDFRLHHFLEGFISSIVTCRGRSDLEVILEVFASADRLPQFVARSLAHASLRPNDFVTLLSIPFRFREMR